MELDMIFLSLWLLSFISVILHATQLENTIELCSHCIYYHHDPHLYTSICNKWAPSGRRIIGSTAPESTQAWQRTKSHNILHLPFDHVTWAFTGLSAIKFRSSLLRAQYFGSFWTCSAVFCTCIKISHVFDNQRTHCWGKRKRTRHHFCSSSKTDKMESKPSVLLDPSFL